MKQLNINKLYFKDIAYIGNLYLDKVFFEFEGIPIIFSCKDINGNYYLCHCNEIRGVQKWNIVKTSKSIIIDMLTDKITVYEALKKSSLKVICAEYKRSYSKIKTVICNFEDIDEADLPDKDEYLEEYEAFKDYINKLRSELTFSISFISYNSLLHDNESYINLTNAKNITVDYTSPLGNFYQFDYNSTDSVNHIFSESIDDFENMDITAA